MLKAEKEILINSMVNEINKTAMPGLANIQTAAKNILAKFRNQPSPEKIKKLLAMIGGLGVAGTAGYQVGQGTNEGIIDSLKFEKEQNQQALVDLFQYLQSGYFNQYGSGYGADYSEAGYPQLY